MSENDDYFYEPPESAFESNRGNPPAKRPVNRAEDADFSKSNKQGRQKDSNNGKW